MPIMGLGPFQTDAPFGSILDENAKARAEAISSDASSHVKFLALAYEQANENDVDAILSNLKDKTDAFEDYVCVCNWPPDRDGREVHPLLGSCLTKNKRLSNA